MAPTSNSSSIYYLLIIIFVEYSGIALSVWVQCLVPAESSANLPTSYLLVLILIATQEIHHNTYIASHIVGHDYLESHQANEVQPPPEDPFLYTKYLG